MSFNHKLFTIGAISVLGAAAFGKVGLGTIRKPKSRFTAEHWVGLLSGSNHSRPQSNGIGLDTIREPKANFTAEHWISLLSGSKQASSPSNGTAKATNSVGAPAEIIGRAGYSLHRS